MVAADVLFPNTDGSGKILSPEAWGGTVPTTDRPKFSIKNPTFSVDRDGTFNGMYIDVGDSSTFYGKRSYNFQFQDGAKLRLTDPIHVSTRWSAVNEYASLNFTDGYLDFGGKNLRTGTTGNEAYWLKMNFSNCTVTNVDQMWIGYKANHDELTISGGTTYVNNGLMPFRTPGSGCTDVRIHIDGGAKVSVGHFAMSRTWNGGPVLTHTDGQPLVDISGSGTEVVLRGNAPSPYSDLWDGLDDEVKAGGSFLTALGTGEMMRIRDGAKVTIQSGVTYIGYGSSSNGRVIVEGEGSELSVGSVRFAHKGTAEKPGSNNYIVVRDGGKLTATTIWSQGSFGTSVGSDNGIICSNGLVSVVGPKDGGAKNRFVCHLQGDHPEIKFVADKNGEGAFLWNGLDWRFDLPTGGYQAGSVPFKFACRQFLRTDANASVLTCQINGLPAFAKDMRAKGELTREVTLFSGLSFASYSDYSDVKFREAVTQWNTDLQEIVPDGFRAQLSIVGSTVVLKVKRQQGMILVFR